MSNANGVGAGAPSNPTFTGTPTGTTFTVTNTGSGYTTVSPSYYGYGGGGGTISSTSGYAQTTYTYTYPSITTEKLIVGEVDMGECMKKIMQRLSILEEPSQEKLDKHAALKQAYLNYKMLEALFIDEGDK